MKTSLHSPKGVVLISGSVGSGKTAMALGCGAKPSEIAYFDWDGKDVGIDPSAFGAYVNLADTSHVNKSKGSVAAIEQLSDLLEKIEKKPNGIRVIVFDNWGSLSSALLPWIQKNQATIVNSVASSGIWKQKSVLGFRKYYEAALLAHLATKFETVFAISHRTQYVDGRKANLMVPDFSTPVFQKAIAAFWLVRTSEHPTPQVLVFKSPPVRGWDDSKGAIVTKPFLPPKLSRECLGGSDDGGYVSVWDMYNHYLSSPYNPHDPRVYESLSENEMNLVLETMQPDERDIYQKSDNSTSKKLSSDLDNVPDDAWEIIAENTEMGLLELNALLNESGLSVPPARLKLAINSLKENI